MNVLSKILILEIFFNLRFPKNELKICNISIHSIQYWQSFQSGPRAISDLHVAFTTILQKFNFHEKEE